MDGIWGLGGWKWMFIMVSWPAAVVGLICWRVLPDSPRDAAWLTREERDAIAAMHASETHDRPKHSVWTALTDPRVIVLALVQFGFTLGSYGVTIWLPLIVKDYGLSNVAVGFLVAVPYVFATIGMLVWARLVDKTGKKIFNMTMALAVGVVGLAGYSLSGSLLFSLTDLTLALVGITAARGIFWAIPPRILTGVGAAAGIAFINSIGTFGGLVGPTMMGVFKDATGGFTLGILAMAGVMVVTTVLSASLKFMVRQE
jgi:cyanate permease